MKLEEVSPEMLSVLCKTPSCGAVLMNRDDDQEKISMLYAIKEDYILLDCFLGGSNLKSDISITASGKEDSSKLIRRFVGSVVIDSEGITYSPSCSFQHLVNLLHASDASYMKHITKEFKAELLSMIKEIQKSGKEQFTTPANIDEYKAMQRELPRTAAQYAFYAEKYNILKEAFKMFLFVHTAQGIRMDYVTDNDPVCTYRRADKQVRDYIRVDSAWDIEINVINPFSVSGHFRMQPCGKGRQERKLIYIDSYIKQGYHRKCNKELTLNKQ